jgi:uncharacterized protein
MSPLSNLLALGAKPKVMESPKQKMERIFAAFAVGNSQPFLDLLTDDFCWTVMGSSIWSGTYEGKEVVLSQLFAPIFAQFQNKYISRAKLIIAQDDTVVVECKGEVLTKKDQPYNNSYCWVCRFRDGRLAAVTEYLDTVLVNEVLIRP